MSFFILNWLKKYYTNFWCRKILNQKDTIKAKLKIELLINTLNGDKIMFKLGLDDIRFPSLGKVIVFAGTLVVLMWVVRNWAPAGIKKLFTA